MNEAARNAIEADLVQYQHEITAAEGSVDIARKGLEGQESRLHISERRVRELKAELTKEES